VIRSPSGDVAPTRTKWRRRTGKNDTGATHQTSQLVGPPPVGATDQVRVASLSEVSGPPPSGTC